MIARIVDKVPAKIALRAGGEPGRQRLRRLAESIPSRTEQEACVQEN